MKLENINLRKIIKNNNTRNDKNKNNNLFWINLISNVLENPEINSGYVIEYKNLTLFITNRVILLECVYLTRVKGKRQRGYNN